MQPIKITNVSQIKNPEILHTLESLQDDQVILIFSDGVFTKISDKYEGALKTPDNKVITPNPIDMNWRPIWVGPRLFNSEMRLIRRLYFQDVSYITHYIQNDIIK